MRLLLLVLISWLVMGEASAAQPKDTINPERFSQITFEKALFDKVNSFRKKNGLRPLIFNQMIHQAAKDHCEYLQRTGKLTHEQDNLKSKTAYDRVKKYIKSGRFVVGENLARTVILKPSQTYDSNGNQFTTTAYTYEQAVQYLFNAWKQSSFHKKNMLKDKYTITAISVKFDENKNTVTAVQVFAHFS